MAQTATVTLSANATAVVASLRNVQSEIARTAQVCATRARTFAEAFSPLVISIQGVTGAEWNSIIYGSSGSSSD